MTGQTSPARDEALPEFPAYARPAWFAVDAAEPPPPPPATAARPDYAEAIRKSVEHYRRNAPALHERYEDYFVDRHTPPPPPPRRVAYREPARRRNNFGRDFFVASCLAAATVAVVGLMLYDRNNSGALSRPLLLAWIEKSAPAPAAAPVAAPAKRENIQVVTKGGVSTIVKKPIPTATLQVADVTGDLGAPITLSLAAAPAGPGQHIVLRVSGLPASAFLSAGKRLDDTSWILREGEERGVKLTLPAGSAPTTVLTIAAVEPKTGELVAPVQEIAVNAGKAGPVILPAAAAPETQKPVATKPPLFERILSVNAQPAEADAMIIKGDKLVAAGEMAAARDFYGRAMGLGSKNAALKLGATFDPLVFAQRNVRGLQPDAAKALDYYERAQASGVPGAGESIAALKSHLGQ